MSENYDSLKLKLEEDGGFPKKYMFKFIVPKGNVHQLLPHFETADISSKNSKTGKYISISATIMAFSADDIVEKYQSIGQIEGLISL